MARLLGFGIGRLRLAAPVQPKAPSDSQSVLTRWMGIQDANTAGNVHRGTIMRRDQIGTLATVGDGSYRLTLRCGAQVAVSERYVGALRALM